MSDLQDLPGANVEQRWNLSIVWLLPLIAALVGGWLVYDTWRQRGPTIELRFTRGDGIEAGTTTLRYKAVEVGKVIAIRIADDLRNVVVMARIDRSFESQLNDGTRFWVVRPRIGAQGVSGLGTLVSGAYIEVDPAEGAPLREFIGLESPPIVPADVPGRRYVLESERLGSIQAGSAIFFRDIQVGEVLGYKLTKDGSRVTIHIFVREPYTLLVRASTEFSNASGVDVSVNADGVNLRTSTLQSLLVGGITFDLPMGNAEEAAPSGTTFRLYDGPDTIGEAQYTENVGYHLYFDDSVRGLSVGAPVEFKGLKLGSVESVGLEVDEDTFEIRIPVMINLQPQRLSSTYADNVKRPRAVIEALIEQGLRAQLQTGNLLTGQMFIELGMHPGTRNVLVKGRLPGTQIPTIPSEFVAIKQSASALLDKLHKLPLGEMSEKTVTAIEGFERLVRSPKIEKLLVAANTSFASLERLTNDLDAELEPLAARLNKTLSSVDEDSALHTQLRQTLDRIDDAARAVRDLSGAIERSPNSLIWGKKKQKDVQVE